MTVSISKNYGPFQNDAEVAEKSQRDQLSNLAEKS